jgi:adenosine deaminase
VNTVALARERGTVFEVCVTSNVHTGVVGSVREHPVMKMLNAGLNVALCSDDPSISQITLSDEYRHICGELGMDRTTLQLRILAAARASFMGEAERDILVAQLRKEMNI